MVDTSNYNSLYEEYNKLRRKNYLSEDEIKRMHQIFTPDFKKYYINKYTKENNNG